MAADLPGLEVSRAQARLADLFRNVVDGTSVEVAAAPGADELLCLPITPEQRRAVLEDLEAELTAAGWHRDYVAPFIAAVSAEADL